MVSYSMPVNPTLRCCLALLVALGTAVVHAATPEAPDAAPAPSTTAPAEPADAAGAILPVTGTLAPPASAPAAAPPFAYVLGKTTFHEAFIHWTRERLKVVDSGFLALDPVVAGRRDGYQGPMLEDVLLYDIQRPDFYDLRQARFFFFEKTLYKVMVPFWDTLARDFPHYTDAEIRELEKRLVRQYGPPHERKRSFWARGKKPDVSIWHLKGNDLILITDRLWGGLTWVNPALQKQVDARRKDVCKRERLSCR